VLRCDVLDGAGKALGGRWSWTTTRGTSSGIATEKRVAAGTYGAQLEKWNVGVSRPGGEPPGRRYRRDIGRDFFLALLAADRACSDPLPRQRTPAGARCSRTWLFFFQNSRRHPKITGCRPIIFRKRPRGIIAHRNLPTNLGAALAVDVGCDV